MNRYAKFSISLMLAALTALSPAAVLAQTTEDPMQETTEMTQVLAEDILPAPEQPDVSEEEPVIPDTTVGGTYKFVVDAKDDGEIGVSVFTWKLDLATGTLYLDVDGLVPAEFDYVERELPWEDYREEIRKAVLGQGFTAVGLRMFEEYAALEEVELPDTITEFYNYAFCECSSLKTINIPQSVTRIGTSSFRGCKSLDNVTLPENLTRLGKRVFGRCAGLTKIEIPDGITTIDSNTFSDCTSLKEVKLHKGVTKIKSEAFLRCKSLKTIALPSGVTEIGDRAFEQCTGMAEIKLPKALTKLGNNAFYHCSKLKSISIPSGVTELGAYAFGYCRALETVKLPKNLTKIGDSAFYYCDKLTSISIPQTVTSIGSWAFEYCRALTELKLPEGLTAIGYGAFYSCKGLTSMTIPEGVTKIPGSLFSQCTGLTEIQLPQRVTSIGGSAFYGCSKLTELTLPEGFSKLDYGTFDSCKRLTTLHIPKSVTKINCGFYNCSRLESITVDADNEYFTSIDGVLLNKKATKILVYPDGKKSGAYVVPSTVTKLNFYTLQNNADSYLKRIVVPKSIKKFEGRTAKNQLIVTEQGSMAWLYAKEYNLAKTSYNNYTPYSVWNLSCEEYYSYYKLKWSASSSAAGYLVYRYDPNQKKYVRVATTTSKSYKVPRVNRNDKYAVRAFTVRADGTMNISGWRYITVK